MNPYIKSSLEDIQDAHDSISDPVVRTMLVAAQAAVVGASPDVDPNIVVCEPRAISDNATYVALREAMVRLFRLMRENGIGEEAKTKLDTAVTILDAAATEIIRRGR